MNTLWQEMRDGPRALSRPLHGWILMLGLGAASLTYSMVGLGALCRAPAGESEQRYAAQEIRSEPNDQAAASAPRYLDYRDRSVPLLIW